MATKKRTKTKTKTKRTRKGTVTAAERKRSGMKGGQKKGKYPIFDQESCLSAVKLRHSGKGVTASSVLAKASRWANKNNNTVCKNAITKARAVDKERK